MRSRYPGGRVDASGAKAGAEMGEAGVEPAKAKPDGLQPPSFDLLDTPPAAIESRGGPCAVHQRIDRWAGVDLEVRVLGPTQMERISRVDPTRSTSGLWPIFNLNTKKEELLFRNGHNVQWHPDGKKLGYISDNKIYIYDITDKTKQLIYTSEKENLIDSLTWSPNGQWIGFQEGNYKKGIGMNVISQNGGGKEQLIESDVASLSWSPEGNKIAFTTVGSPGSNDLFLLEVPEKYR